MGLPPLNRRRRSRHLLAALAFVAALVLALPAIALARPTRFDTGLQDPLDPNFHDPDPAHALSVARQQDVRFIRIPVSWSSIAGSQPADPTNPADSAYLWSALDARLAAVKQNGMEPILVLYGTPRWAQVGGTLTPNTGAFGEFAAAAAKRYDGSGVQPRVRYWQIWNEPNISVYFGQANGPQNYRAVVNAGAAAIHAAAPDNTVIAGGLGPIGGNLSTAPLAFMRQLLCVSAGAHPHATCSAKVSFDVWSHHPYSSGGPNHHAAGRDDVEIGDLAKMRKVLSAAHRLHRIAPDRAPAFWITEFSWDTDAPDPGGVPLKLHARWVAEAFYRMWANGVSMVAWFQLRDAPAGPGWGYTWQAGLFERTTATTKYSNEKQKPVAQVVRFPFAAVPSGNRVTVWGRTPDAGPGSVTIEYRSNGRWRRAASLSAGAHGIFTRRLSGLRGKLVRAREASTTALPFKAVPTPDRAVRPFGGPIQRG
jgi:hypothetical protein